MCHEPHLVGFLSLRVAVTRIRTGQSGWRRGQAEEAAPCGGHPRESRDSAGRRACGAPPGRHLKKFNQARVNGGSNYDSLEVAKCLVI